MRRRKSRWKGIFLVVAVIVLLVCVVLWKFVFVVRNVEFTGNLGGYSAQDLIRASGVNFGGSMMRVSEADVQRRINSTEVFRFESMQLDYPNTVYIGVHLRSRDAMLLHMGKIRVLDDTGCVVESMNEVPDTDLLYVSGMRVLNYEPGTPLTADEGQLEAYCAVVQALNQHGADMYVSELKLDNPDSMLLITRTGITVELGDARNMPDKIAWMKSAVADLENRRENGGTLDVSSGTKADYSRNTGT